MSERSSAIITNRKEEKTTKHQHMSWQIKSENIYIASYFISFLFEKKNEEMYAKMMRRENGWDQDVFGITANSQK